jgi:hypothetical protein
MSHLSTIIHRVKHRLDSVYKGDTAKAAKDSLWVESIHNLRDYSFGDETGEETEEANRLLALYQGEFSTKKIVERLIGHYGAAIEEYEMSKDYSVLVDMSVDSGVCACVDSLGWYLDDYDEFYSQVIKPHVRNSFWYSVPSDSESFEYNLDCLKYRYDILNRIYQ